VTVAKAYGIHAIDMVLNLIVRSRHLIEARPSQVNINYQDEEYHREECLEGRQLGFTGKVSNLSPVQSRSSITPHLQQAIHPSQVAGINEAYRPSDKGAFFSSCLPAPALTGRPAVLRAAKIMHETKLSHDAGSGAFGLATEGGKKEMIDAPMVKQVRIHSTTFRAKKYNALNQQAKATLRMAKMCDVAIPDVGGS
jgi:citrate lyase subunit beta-like protein